jgi:hypothetical protein
VRLWREPAARAAAIDAILAAWEHDDQPALDAALRRVDHAVVLGLTALGLPRGTIARRRFERVERGFTARKEPGCDLVFDAVAVHLQLRVHRAPDDLFCTWVHESIHARQPYADGHRRESTTVRGYEEGLAEGLARLVVLSQPGMAHAPRRRGDYYVAAYEELAALLGRPVEAVWRLLWPLPAGRVQAGFRDALPDLLGRRLAGSRILMVARRADSIFATAQAQR